MNLRSLTIDKDGQLYAAGIGFTLAKFNLDGSLDTNFGTGGIVQGPGTDADAIISTQDGGLLLTGYSGSTTLTVKFNKFGTLDASFGNNGSISHTTAGRSNVGYSLAEMSDGNILEASISAPGALGAIPYSRSATIQISMSNSNGQLISDFGGDGLIDVGSEVYGWAVHVGMTNNGKIIAGGANYSADDKTDVFVYAINNDGSIDTNFGLNGTAEMSLAGYYEQATNLLVNNKNQIFMTGSVANGQNFFDIPFDNLATNSDFYIASFNADGSVNTKFGGGDGIVTTDFGGIDLGMASALQADGKIIIAGQTNALALNQPISFPWHLNDDLILARYLSNGNLDPKFGNGGKVAIELNDMLQYQQSVPGAWFEVTDVKIQKSGDIAVLFIAGSQDPTTTINNLFIFNSNGQLKSTQITDTSRGHTLNASDVSDRINALGGDDVIYAGLGNDIIDPGSGDDIVDGGEGLDTVDYSNVESSLNINLNSGEVLNNESVGDDILISIENINAGSANDHLQGNGDSNIINANAGNDWIIGDLGNDIINGGRGIDTLDYAEADNALTINLQNFTASGSEIGFDKIYAIEHLNTGNGNDSIVGNSSDNFILSNGGNDNINGGAGDDYLYASEGGGDFLHGGLGKDTLVAGSGRFGNDKYDGGIGRDIIDYSVASSHIKVDLNLKINNVFAINTDGSMDLNDLARIGIDSISNIEDVYGGDYNDILLGNASSNEIEGMEGNDILDGRLGNDDLLGGSGSDVFRFTTRLNAKSNKDTITDFTPGTDRIYLDDAIFRKFTGDNNQLRNISTDNFLVLGDRLQDVNDYIIYNDQTGSLFYDADGSGRGMMIEFANLSNYAALTYSDISIV
jgi:uncharacterized delta-60 repeat protein